MFDLRAIRDDPASFDRGWARRGLEARSQDILALDADRRQLQTRIQQGLARRNEASKEVGDAKRRKDEETASALMAEVAQIKAELPELEAQEKAQGEQLDALLASLPNMPAADVPDGPDETGNVEIRKFGIIPNIPEPRDHVALGEELGLMDFGAASALSGARFTVLAGALSRLERALGQFMLDLHTSEFGYREMSVPIMVRDKALFGTSQLPKFAEDLFQTTNGYWLIPTAEVSLTNLAADQIIESETLPLRMTALTPCFRAEAGAAGRDTRGMIRQHQFWKVELVSVTTQDQSDAEHERMTDAAETVLKRLGLPFRTMLLCSGDMGFAARKTYDLEVWLPGQQAYREISSCSNCGDFQARRMKARTRPRGGEGTPEFVHTLNGSGLAVGRALVAVIENYQQPDGSIVIPDVLRPYMGGLEVISANG
ncbi:MAG TPA: serine--tRNA ligase [Alphaproteobacteria bacterium]|nr:serine--tRNA ligase [Alphaproteobacteria bacterium]